MSGSGRNGRAHGIGHGSGERLRPNETAAYIAEVAAELSEMARGSELDLLAYLLEIAGLEAREAFGPPPKGH